MLPGSVSPLPLLTDDAQTGPMPVNETWAKEGPGTLAASRGLRPRSPCGLKLKGLNRWGVVNMPTVLDRLLGKGGKSWGIKVPTASMPSCPLSVPPASAQHHLFQEASLISAASWEGLLLSLHPEPHPAPPTTRHALPSLHPPGQGVSLVLDLRWDAQARPASTFC